MYVWQHDNGIKQMKNRYKHVCTCTLQIYLHTIIEIKCIVQKCF